MIFWTYDLFNEFLKIHLQNAPILDLFHVGFGWSIKGVYNVFGNVSYSFKIVFQIFVWLVWPVMTLSIIYLYILIISEAFYVRGPLVWEFHVPLGSKFRQNMVSFSKICVNIQCYDHQIIYQNCTRCHQIACTFSKILGGDTPNPPRARGSAQCALYKKVQQNQKRSKIWVILPNNIFLPTALEGHDVLCLWGGSWTFSPMVRAMNFCHFQWWGSWTSILSTSDFSRPPGCSK